MLVVFLGTIYATWDGILKFFASDEGKISRDIINTHIQFRSEQYQGNYAR